MYKLVYNHCTATESIQVWRHLNNIIGLLLFQIMHFTTL